MSNFSYLSWQCSMYAECAGLVALRFAAQQAPVYSIWTWPWWVASTSHPTDLHRRFLVVLFYVLLSSSFPLRTIRPNQILKGHQTGGTFRVLRLFSPKFAGTKNRGEPDLFDKQYKWRPLKRPYELEPNKQMQEASYACMNDQDVTCECVAVREDMTGLPMQLGTLALMNFYWNYLKAGCI